MLMTMMLMACAPAPLDSGGGAHEPDPLPLTIDEERTIDGRRYALYAPGGLDRAAPTPLVLNFHGHTPEEIDAVAAHRLITEMDAHAEERGYIVAFPAGREGYWSYDDADDADVRLAEAIVAALDDELLVGPVYATGFSSGAIFSYRLACERPGLLSGIGAVAGMIRAEGCPGGGALPALAMFHGTDDERVSIADGEAAAEAWLREAGCDPGAGEIVFAGEATTCTAWPACGVETCVSEGAGHTWPGTSGSSTLLTLTGEGPTALDISANERMWALWQSAP